MGYSNPLPAPDAGPVTAAERLVSLDTLRGVAVMGILVMNVYAFAMPLAAYSNPLLMGGGDALNVGTWFFIHLFFDQKFMSIFAMLYGAGVVMTTVFYGHGFGLYAEVPRFCQQGFVAAFIGLQLMVSPWRLKHFRFGPAEWLWRSFTYRQRQPMRR